MTPPSIPPQAGGIGVASPACGGTEGVELNSPALTGGLRGVRRKS